MRPGKTTLREHLPLMKCRKYGESGRVRLAREGIQSAVGRSQRVAQPPQMGCGTAWILGYCFLIARLVSLKNNMAGRIYHLLMSLFVVA